MAVEVFGGAVNHGVGAQGQGLLEVRRAEGVVHDYPDVGLEVMGGLGNQGDVQNLHGGVAGSLEIHHLGLFGHGLFEVFNVAQVGEGDLDAELAQAVLQQGVGAAIQSLVRHDLVPGGDGAPKSGGNSAHAGGGCQSVFAAFQVGHLGFHQVGGGVAQAAVDVTLFLAGEAGAALLHRRKLKSGGLVNRGAQRAGGVLYLAGVDLAGGEALVLTVHNCLPSFLFCAGRRRLMLEKVRVQFFCY